jgi:mono/diheme cytochrome c family protein
MSSRSYDLVEEANAVNTEGMGNIKSDDISSQAYLMRCGFCHGSNLEGIPGLGATLEDSLFLQNMNIQQTIQFLNAGRMPNSEDSISGGVMPSFSWLPDSELEAIAMYIKSQKISE